MHCFRAVPEKTKRSERAKTPLSLLVGSLKTESGYLLLLDLWVQYQTEESFEKQLIFFDIGLEKKNLVLNLLQMGIIN